MTALPIVGDNAALAAAAVVSDEPSIEVYGRRHEGCHHSIYDMSLRMQIGAQPQHEAIRVRPTI